MAPRWQCGWNYVARPRKKERQRNHLLYAKAAAVSMRTLGLEASSVEGFRHGGCVKADFRQQSTK
jgi:hypothetical protein